MMKLILGGQDNGLTIQLFKVTQVKVTEAILARMKTHKEKIYNSLPIKVAYFEQHIQNDTLTNIYLLKIIIVKKSKFIQAYMPLIGKNSCAKREIIFPFERYTTTANIDEFYIRGNFQLLNSVKELGIILSKTNLSQQQKVEIMTSRLLYRNDVMTGKVPVDGLTFQALARGNDVKFVTQSSNKEDMKLVVPRKKRKL